MKFDELNQLTQSFLVSFFDLSKYSPSELCDSLLEMLIIAYSMGVDQGNEDLGTNKGIDQEDLFLSLYKEYGGETFIDRINKHYANQDIEALNKVADTEIHRLYNDGVFFVGKGENALKTWNTMLDDKVRETHDYLEGMTLPIDMPFETFDGDFGNYPGDFENANNNCNCRCYITLSKA